MWVAAVSAAELRGATNDELDEAATRLAVALPEDYRALMRRVDGGESDFGASWVSLTPAVQLAEVNDDCQVAELAPGFTYFGSNGAGEAYAWDWREARRSLYVVIPFISPAPAAAVPCGDTLEEFLATLYRGIPFGRSC